MQERGKAISAHQLDRARSKHVPTHNKRERAVAKLTFDPSPDVIDLLLEHADTQRKELLILVNAAIVSVRATADGRGPGRPAGRGCGAGGGSHAGGRGAPVQEGGEAISEDQLYKARDKHDPKPNFTIADDNKIIELFEKGFTPAAVAAELASVSGVSPKRVDSRWKDVLKPLREKTKPRENDRGQVAAPRWTDVERDNLAEAAVIVRMSSMYDEHCNAAGAPSAMWSTVAHLMGTRRSGGATVG